MSLSKYILKHVLVNIFDHFDISYTIYIYTYIHMRSALWSPELNQLTREMRSEAPNWTNWLVKCVLKPRTEQNDLRSEVPNLIKWFALWSPELNQMIRALRSEVPNWTKSITTKHIQEK